MPPRAAKNLHVPLPESIYRRLRRESERTQRPATALARKAIDEWLEKQRRISIHESIAAYASGAAGTHDDLDPEMEKAGIEHLLNAAGEPDAARRP